MSHPHSKDENPWHVHMADTRAQHMARELEEEEKNNHVNQSHPLPSSYESY